jgi:hypothetical protein
MLPIRTPTSNLAALWNRTHAAGDDEQGLTADGQEREKPLRNKGEVTHRQPVTSEDKSYRWAIQEANTPPKAQQISMFRKSVAQNPAQLIPHV